MNDKQLDEYLLAMFGNVEMINNIQRDPFTNSIYKVLRQTIKTNIELRYNANDVLKNENELLKAQIKMLMETKNE